MSTSETVLVALLSLLALGLLLFAAHQMRRQYPAQHNRHRRKRGQKDREPY